MAIILSFLSALLLLSSRAVFFFFSFFLFSILDFCLLRVAGRILVPRPALVIEPAPPSVEVWSGPPGKSPDPCSHMTISLQIFHKSGPTGIDWEALGVEMPWMAGCRRKRISIYCVEKPQVHGSPPALLPPFRQQLCSQTTVCNFNLISFTVSPLLEVPGDLPISDLFDKRFQLATFLTNAFVSCSHQIVLLCDFGFIYIRFP